jgi:hypothetical protein
VLDLAVPQLRFGLRASRTHEATRNTHAPLGSAAANLALARGAGWEAAALPPGVLLTGVERPSAAELRRGIKAFLLEHTRLPQLLMGPSVVWPEMAAPSGWDLEGEFERIG